MVIDNQVAQQVENKLQTRSQALPFSFRLFILAQNPKRYASAEA